MDNPRKLALLSLIKSDSVQCYSNIEINTTIKRTGLKDSDSSLYTALYLGVLDKKIYLDYIIKQYSDISFSKIETETRNILRLGLYQLIFMDKIPDYSSVNECVSLSNKRSKGFVNALLRAFIRKKGKVTLPDGEWERISTENSIPVGITDIFRESYGDETARELCTFQMMENSISIRVNTIKHTVKEAEDYLKKEGIEYRFSDYSDEIIKCRTSINNLDYLLENGYCFVQDESSFCAIKILNPEEGSSVIDACACPGGKSFSCAEEMNNKGLIISADLHANKLSLVKNTAEKLGIDIIKTEEQDGKQFRQDYKEKFDFAVCDVPCSGLGVIYRKADIKYKSTESINQLPEIQYDILNNVSKYLKKGGILIYSTCTLNKKENEDNIERFLKENGDFSYVDFEYKGIKSKKGTYTFLPHITNTDGFFVAKMKRENND